MQMGDTFASNWKEELKLVIENSNFNDLHLL